MLMGKELRLESSSNSDFSFEFLSKNFQYVNACLGAAYEVLGLGFDLVMIMEWNWLVI